jgi:quercetin dioxygenase-like cupin family protein
MMSNIMTASIVAFALMALFGGIKTHAAEANGELPTSNQIPGVKPEVLLRAGVPDAPGKVLIVTRTTYDPGAHVGWHRHNGQITFYILRGTMEVQNRGAPAFALKPGDSLLVQPGTIHQHWNASSRENLQFLEYIILDKRRPSIVFEK